MLLRPDVYEVNLPVSIVAGWKVIPEVASAALLAAQGRNGDQPCDCKQVELPPRVSVHFG